MTFIEECQQQLEQFNRLDAKRAQELIDRLKMAEEAINWVCGCGEEDFQPPPDKKPRYWWRARLTEKAGMVWDRDTLRYVDARAQLEDR